MRTKKRMLLKRTLILPLAIVGVALTADLNVVWSQSEVVTEANIRAAIINSGQFTQDQINQMDLNGDGKLDVADLITFLVLVASFATATSQVAENTPSDNVVVNFSRPVQGTLNFTTGGSAAEGTDYAALTKSVPVNGTSVSIRVSPIDDAIYEGPRTIVLSLLPGQGFFLGSQRTHTITLTDDTAQSSANYRFILSSHTPGIGDTGSAAQMKGFPPSLFSRTASVNITFSQNGVLAATLDPTKSIGLAYTGAKSDVVPAKSISYSGTTLTIQFQYATQLAGFLSSAVLQSVSLTDIENGTMPAQPKTPLTNTLTLVVNNLNVATDKFTSKYLTGTYSLSIAGVLHNGTPSFFDGTLAAAMQQ